MLGGEQLLQGWAISLLLSEAGQNCSSRRPRLATTASSRAACRIKVTKPAAELLHQVEKIFSHRITGCS